MWYNFDTMQDGIQRTAGKVFGRFDVVIGPGRSDISSLKQEFCLSLKYTFQFLRGCFRVVLKSKIYVTFRTDIHLPKELARRFRVALQALFTVTFENYQHPKHILLYSLVLIVIKITIKQ